MDADEMSGEARRQIAELPVRYAHLIDHDETERLGELFEKDVVFVVRDQPPVVGRESVISMLRSGHVAFGQGRPGFHRHDITNVVITQISSSEVAMSCYFVVLTPDGLDNWGRYEDVVVQTGDGWRFARRTVFTDGYSPTSWHPAAGKP